MMGMRTRGGKKDGVPPLTTEETNNRSEDPQESVDDAAEIPAANAGIQNQRGTIIESTNEAPPNNKNRFAKQKVFFGLPPTAKNATITTQQTPPPINILLKKDSPVDLISLRGYCYVTKNLNNYKQVLPNSLDDYNGIIDTLKTNHIEHYTYSPVDNSCKLDKFVLYGLTNDDQQFIAEDLREYGFTTYEISKMRITKQRYNEQATFIVYFDHQDGVTLKTLEKARYINHTVVSWAHYIHTPTAPIQCRRCMRFGHGTSTCAMSPRCLICAESHVANVCPLIVQKREMQANEIQQSKLVCCNCRGNHTATDKFCPSRPKPKPVPQPPQRPQVIYTPAPQPSINPWQQPSSGITTTTAQQVLLTPHQQAASSSTMALAAAKRTPRPIQQKSTQQSNPTINTAQPKHLHSTTVIPGQQLSSNKQTITTEHQESDRPQPFTNTVSPGQQSNSSINDLNYNSSTNSHQTLFSPNEMLSIFREMLDVVRTCKTRNEMLNSLMALTLKYAECPV